MTNTNALTTESCWNCGSTELLPNLAGHLTGNGDICAECHEPQDDTFDTSGDPSFSSGGSRFSHLD